MKRLVGADSLEPAQVIGTTGMRRSGSDTVAFGPSDVPRQDHPTLDVTERRPMRYPAHHEPGSRTKKAIVEHPNSRQAS
jgi:hypothetical protein